ncbi:alpha/beta fold hydrolase [Rhodococcus sp. HM1]|uniref:alpha/beta fold hydrolase n=1 Tax=Rhodococcus sp. HM1 TaxID=2937759 RepID=UPI00200AA3E7|nr:alpha/beta fold hydrolase [Rhodococcus sp. HM1]MCK8672033.1 alpha/beta fold hydrolase [Rhodococcus sp. HM1]
MVFLPGWGLTPWVYRRAPAQLARSCRVYAPAVPGLTAAPVRPLDRKTLAACSTWLGRFLDAVGLWSVTLLAHSFGGALAIQTAHDLPDRVARLVLVNSVGGGAWPDLGGAVPPLGDGPVRGRGTTLEEAQSLRILASATPSRPTGNDGGVPETVGLTDRVPPDRDLTAELTRLAQRHLPVSLVWSRGDRLIPRASIETLRSVLGRPRMFTVSGGHGWPITAPEYFGNAMRTVLNGFPIEVAS